MRLPERRDERLFEAEADEHWKWLRCFLKDVCDVDDEALKKYGRIYFDAMVHGYKHGYQDALDEVEEGKKS
jgi:hypothetical protein